MQKYGFVYIWYDKKHKRFYIGCHWGREDDGYICSSSWMKQAYKRRPKDFKRRILKKNIEKENLLNEEYKWLILIPDNLLGKKYYNLHNHKKNHWSFNDNLKLTISEKISLSHKKHPNWGWWSKGRKFSIEHRKKLSIAKVGKSSVRKGQKHTAATRLIMKEKAKAREELKRKQRAPSL